MRSLIRYSFSLFVFWMVVFLPLRLFFILYQLPFGAKIQSTKDVLFSFFGGYQLDVATGIILSGLPVFMVWLFFITGWKKLISLSKYTLLTLLILYAAIAIGDAGLYREWQAKINLQALSHFKNPKEIFNTISLPLQGLFILLVTFFTWFFFRLYKRKIHSPFCKPHFESAHQVDRLSDHEDHSTPTLHIGARGPWFMIFLFLPLYATISVIGIRGGITNLPISQSVAYFSQDMLANDMAVNPLYNLLQDMTIQGTIPDRSFYVHYAKEEVTTLLQNYYHVSTDSSLPIITTQSPNVVFIILESWSADEVGCLGGISNATPCLDTLAKEGITFERAYASAYISDQGIPAILSGYPGLSKISAINQPSLLRKLPSLSKDLRRRNYSTAFLYGGDLVFGNIKGYVTAMDYDVVQDVRQFSSLPQGRLGVHDEYMLPQLLQKCHHSRQPFMNVLFTLSTHMPYDFLPKENWKAPTNDVEARYSESIHYSDRAIGDFFSEAKKQDWYKNTLFILTADHSHNTFKQNDLALPERHHIPLFILGGALRDEVKGMAINKVVAQMDITKTLCKQLNMDGSAYIWSRDLFNPFVPSGAYFPFYGGAGFIDDQGFSSGRQMNGGWVSSFTDSLQKDRYGRKAYSFMQKIYEDLYD